jgi:formate dehydrogenase iron-sulfur subunit
MCSHRGDAGPACAEACPTGATITGEREALLADARCRVANDPKTYFQRVYGVTEAGGTDVLFIGPKDSDALGLPNVKSQAPLPDLTWQALKHVPDVVLFGGVLLGGLFWLTKRKEDVARAEHAEKGEHHG